MIVNAGIGGGRRLGTGGFAANRAVAETDFIAALAQAEASLELFRPRDAGHLVLMSSMSAIRGLPGAAVIYGAAKAGLSQLGEGLAIEFLKSPIRVTTIEPGFIHTAINAHRRHKPFAIDVRRRRGSDPPRDRDGAAPRARAALALGVDRRAGTVPAACHAQAHGRVVRRIWRPSHES